MLMFEPAPGREPEVDRVLRHAKSRAEDAGWHCWAYRNEIAANEITLFKSVGASIEDLAAAMLVWRKTGGAEP